MNELIIDMISGYCNEKPFTLSLEENGQWYWEYAERYNGEEPTQAKARSMILKMAKGKGKK